MNASTEARLPLSIIIPTFNTRLTTLKCCRAAVEAAPRACEVIVVDDGSTDGTTDLLRTEAPEVRIVTLDENRGFAAAANEGVAQSRGEIILLLNSDTAIEREAPAVLLDSFASESRLGVAGARLLDPDGTTQWSGGRIPTLPWLLVMVSGCSRFLPRRATRPAGDVEWVSGAAMAFRSDVWNTAGPFSDRYDFYAQDLEFCVRAHDAGWNVRLIETARVVHHGGLTMREWRGVEVLKHDPRMLWPDLLRWGRRHYGPLWGKAALAAMCATAILRIALRRTTELFMRADARRVSRAETNLYVSALRKLGRLKIMGD